MSDMFTSYRNSKPGNFIHYITKTLLYNFRAAFYNFRRMVIAYLWGKEEWREYIATSYFYMAKVRFCLMLFKKSNRLLARKNDWLIND